MNSRRPNLKTHFKYFSTAYETPLQILIILVVKTQTPLNLTTKDSRLISQKKIAKILAHPRRKSFFILYLAVQDFRSMNFLEPLDVPAFRPVASEYPKMANNKMMIMMN